MIEIKDFNTLYDGTETHLVILRNEQKTEVSITNYGGIITSIRTADRKGHLENIVLGYSHIDDYQCEHPFFGAVIGRYANRIEGSRFSLDGETYHLTPSEGENQLHGGKKGFDKVLWNIESTTDDTLTLSYSSPDGEEGFPGTLKVFVSYKLTNQNELIISYKAETDKPTVINLTNHSYFNLTGNPGRHILEHELQLHSNYYTPVDEQSIPTGELAAVEGTPFDFTQPKPIGRDIHLLENGYDHNYVLGERLEDAPRMVARLKEPHSGRVLETLTDKPGIQLYTGAGLQPVPGTKGGQNFRKFGGVCLETQFFPNSPNMPDFPSCFFTPDKPYQSTTIYRFSLDND
ncbi:aldose epimerase family protein [Balneolaceae bacterium ANBcel3]|nr:aldose epimerase family protein [Balneolaceae bacterium ANBcel3]